MIRSQTGLRCVISAARVRPEPLALDAEGCVLGNPVHWVGALKRFLPWLSLVVAANATQAAIEPGLVAQLETVIQQEMRDWGIGGITVLLTDDQRTLYAAGFGEAKRDSIFRVGSISKLFNAVAVMQQVEAGKLDLDAPLPAELLPLNPFPDAPPVTLRQLLCHRSGVPRECPVGGYLDASEPGLAATVASARGCVLVTRPGEKTRYSNLGPSIAGLLVERGTGQSFEAYQRAHVLGPLGMNQSAWTLARVPRSRLVRAYMRVADGRGGWRRQAAPVFELGTIPAGNLFSTADDLAQFARALLRGGAGLLKAATLAEMWRPQLTEQSTGFGLGFMVDRFGQHRVISHSGAVYGHSSSLVLLPEAKLGVIVLANEDIVGGRVRRISRTALNLLLEARFGEQPAASPAPEAGADLNRFVGEYESQSYWARLEVRPGRLVGEVSGQPTWFSPVAGLKFTADSRIDDATPVEFQTDSAGQVTGFSMGVQRFRKVGAQPMPLPEPWRAVLGSYGPEFIPLVVSERHGHLYVMTENMVDYRLVPVNRQVCQLPPGMYVDEQVVFLMDPKGRVQGINFANMVFARRKAAPALPR